MREAYSIAEQHSDKKRIRDTRRHGNYNQGTEY